MVVSKNLNPFAEPVIVGLASPLTVHNMLSISEGLHKLLTWVSLVCDKYWIWTHLGMHAALVSVSCMFAMCLHYLIW